MRFLAHPLLRRISAYFHTEPRETPASLLCLIVTGVGFRAGMEFIEPFALLGNWGYTTSTILAGAGVGGLAVALAAQKTLESLFGGIAVISDRPVLVGDLCLFGDRTGRVEDIGLCSTRIRTLDRSLVTIPKGQFSSKELETFSRQDRIWFHPRLSLARETTPLQIRELLNSPSHLLASNQELLLHLPEIVTAAGAHLALPTQASSNYEGEPRRPGNIPKRLRA